MKKALIALVVVLVGIFLTSDYWLRHLSLSSNLPPAYLESEMPKVFAQKLESNPKHYLIDNVRILTMQNDSILVDHEVLIKNGLIDTIGQNLSTEGIPIIDGGNGYLMPSLSDMHVHLNSDLQLLLFLTQGVTTVRNLFGDPIHLQMRRQLSQGSWMGPRLITASPIFEGPDNFWPGSTIISNDQEALEAVVEAQAQGYDFIKVYHSLPLEQYSKVLEVSDSLGIPVAGHLPVGWPTNQSLPKLWSFEHLSPRDLAKFKNGQTATETLSQFAQSQSWYCPTLVVHRHLYDQTPTHAIDTAEKYVDPETLKSWQDLNFSSDQDYQEVLKLLKSYHLHGTKLLAGTDVLNPYVIAGFSLHQELQEMVKAGLTPYQALKTATVNPGQFLGKPRGTIAQGQQADLLLLRDNPLENIENTQSIQSVAVQGRWLDRKMLNEMLSSIVDN